MKRRRRLILELTPLLDVILIMMFFILMQNTQLTDKKQSEAQQEVEDIRESLSEALEDAGELESRYGAELSDMKENLEAARDQIGSFESFKEYCKIITISVINKDSGNRTILITDGEKEKSISFGWNDLLYAKNSFKDSVRGFIRETDVGMPSFLVFHYRADTIFRRDYELISEVLGEITEENSSVYVKYSEER